MARPSSSLATLRPDLSGLFEEFSLEMDRANFIGHQVARVRNVAKQAGTFGKVTIESLLRTPETRRAPRTTYQRQDWDFDSDSFATVRNGIEEPVDDMESAMYEDYFEAETWATRRAMDVIQRNAEIRVADLLFNTTTFTGASLTTAAGTPWSTHATSTPVTDVEAAVLKVYANSGLWPNALIISRKVFRHLRLCAEVIDNYKAQGFQDVRPGKINVEHLAAVFDLPFIFVAGGSDNTANSGQAASISSIWDDTMAMVCRVATTDDIVEPCIARTFHWTGAGSVIDGRVETYREEQSESDIVRVKHDTQEKIMYTQLGHLLTAVTA